MGDLPSAALLHRQSDAQPPDRALLEAGNDQRHEAVGDGPIKTFGLCGVKDNPPYLHDERLLTLEDTVEFFNLILGTKLVPQQKQDLVAFLRAL